MQYDEITHLITDSSPDDWEVLPGMPLHLGWLTQMDAGTDEHWVKVDSHTHLAVYRANVGLRLAWGLKTGERMSFDGRPWEVTGLLADAFWQGALVARWWVLHVDEGACYLPQPFTEIVSTGQAIGQPIMDTAKASGVNLARLLQRLVRPGAGAAEFERYWNESRLTEVPD